LSRSLLTHNRLFSPTAFRAYKELSLEPSVTSWLYNDKLDGNTRILRIAPQSLEYTFICWRLSFGQLYTD